MTIFQPRVSFPKLLINNAVWQQPPSFRVMYHRNVLSLSLSLSLSLCARAVLEEKAVTGWFRLAWLSQAATTTTNRGKKRAVVEQRDPRSPPPPPPRKERERGGQSQSIDHRFCLTSAQQCTEEEEEGMEAISRAGLHTQHRGSSGGMVTCHAPLRTTYALMLRSLFCCRRKSAKRRDA